MKAHFGEKHPWAMKPLILFGGLITLQEYTYRFVLSMAKIEIMSIDIPYTDYSSTEEKKEDPVNTSGESLADKLNRESVRKMKERIARQQAQQTKEINLTKLLNKE